MAAFDPRCTQLALAMEQYITLVPAGLAILTHVDTGFESSLKDSRTEWMSSAPSSSSQAARRSCGMFWYRSARSPATWFGWSSFAEARIARVAASTPSVESPLALIVPSWPD